MLPLYPDQTTRVETSLRTDDYELLVRVARSRNTSVAMLLRYLIYEHVQPLKLAQQEREAKSLAEARERKAMDLWMNGIIPKKMDDDDSAAENVRDNAG